MKKLNKVLSVIMVVLMLACISTNVFASSMLNIDDIESKGNLSSDATDTLGTMGGTVLDLITNVGMILAVAVIAIIGVKYMMGSVEEKAEYKKAMMPYLVGAVLVFGASTIAKFAINIF